MALNYSYRPAVLAHIPEYDMWSPMCGVRGFLSEVVSGRNEEGCHALPRHVNRGESEYWGFNFLGDSLGFFRSHETNSKDVADLLPSDPFEMDIDILSDRSDMIWSNALIGDPFSSSILRLNEILCGLIHSIPSDVVSGDTLNMTINGSTSCGSELQVEPKVLKGAAKSEGIPFEAVLPILNFLGVKDLLSVERVCKSLRSTVQSEPWLWRSIQIESPLNERITDDSLSQLVSRAGGKLQCLSLTGCLKVTDDGIRRILETNPQITKLCVPGCPRLTVGGTLNNIKIHNSNKGVPGIKHLRIGHLFGVTRQHFEELNSLLGLNGPRPENHQKPHFYHRGNFYLPFEDERAMDIEMCPKCEKFKLVYNCPAEGCQVKEQGATQMCRACTICIPRCTKCGRCISENNEYVETFLLDLNCYECYDQTEKREGKMSVKVVGTCGLREKRIHPHPR